MNWLDIVIILTLISTTAAAFRAGLVRELVTLAATLLAIVVAAFNYDHLARDVLVFIDNQNAARLIAFLLLFGSIFLMGQLAAFLLRRLVSLLMLGWADHLGGAAFGFLKGLLLIEALLIAFVTFPQLGLDDTIRNSAVAPFFLHANPLTHILPGEFHRAVDAFLA